MRNPLSLEAFADWLEKQPTDKEYVFTSNTECCICQYFDSIGLKYDAVLSRSWWEPGGRDDPALRHDLPYGMSNAANPHDVSGRMNHGGAFGAAAVRARAMLLVK